MASDRQQILDAIAKYGPSVDHIAAQYTNPYTGQRLSGKALIAKLLQGESRALTDPEYARSAVSSAGAKKWGQFMPGTRQDAISRFGVDPWRSIDEAVHATALHLRGKINGSTGLAGYNPGDPSYTSYILGQRVGHLAGAALAPVTGATTGVGGAALAVGGGARVTTEVPSGLLDVPTGSTGMAGAIAARQVVPSAGVQAPAFAAGPTLAPGAMPIPAGGGPAPAPQVQLPEPTQAQLPESPTTTVEGADGVGLVGSAATGAGGAGAQERATAAGRVVIAPGAERDGHGLQRPILGFLHGLSEASGREVDVTTGTNHNQYVVGTQRESDHWTGNAADLGVGADARQSAAAGKKGDLIAAHAIQLASQQAGRGMTFAQALATAKRGGIFNFETPQGRVQILWRTLEGGNHYNHVHVGVNPGA